MAQPPAKSQRAADALLATASLGSRSLAALTKQSASSTTAAPQQQQRQILPQQNPCHQHAKKMGASGCTKRPLASIRGTNDSTLAASNIPSGGVHVGMNHKSKSTPKTTSAVTTAKSSSSNSAFDRRNARDKISKKEAPPTFTDLSLLAMLDGPKKRKVQKPVGVVGAMPPPQKRLNSSRVPPHCIASKKRHKGPDNDVLVVVPPPPTTRLYGHGTVQPAGNTKPRKRMSSHEVVNHSKKGAMKMNAVDSSQTSIERDGGIDHGVEGNIVSSKDEIRVQQRTDLDNQITDDGMEWSVHGEKDTATSSKAPGCNTYGTSANIDEKNCANHLGGEVRPSLPESASSVSSSLSTVRSLSHDDAPTLVNQVNDSKEEQDGATESIDEKSILMPLGISGTKRNKSKPTAIFGSFISSSYSHNRGKNRSIPGVLDRTAVPDPVNKHQSRGSTLADLATGRKDTPILDDTRNEIPTPETAAEDNDAIITIDNNSPKHADWYDPDDLATIEKKAIANVNDGSLIQPQDTSEHSRSRNNARTKKSRGKREGVDVNDNFVRLDLRNAAGSCRGARNMKKVNKQKLWRAQHRFGMNDTNNDNNLERSEIDENVGGGMGGLIHKFGSGWSRRDKRDGGDLKCFSALQNAGVDPLDDYFDGVFSKKDDQNDTSSNNRRNGKDESAILRDESIPICTRHQRPCKLLTVKKNNKGNKGRKFFVCSMPKGEQCDFFKWEEDTVEVRYMFHFIALNQ